MTDRAPEVTPESLTTAQIQAVRLVAAVNGDMAAWDWCQAAIDGDETARALLARIINADWRL